MATFTLFLLQLDDSAQLLIGSYYDSSVTTKKKATSRSPRFQTSPGAAKLTIETSKGKSKRRRRDRDHQQQQQQQSSINSTLQETLQRLWTQAYCALYISFFQLFCPLNHVFIHWGCLRQTPFTRTARAARTDGCPTDHNLFLSFRNLLLNKPPPFFLPNIYLLITTPRNPIYPQKNCIYRYSLQHKENNGGT